MDKSLMLSAEELDEIYTSCVLKPVAQSIEQRASERWAYPAIQLLAPCGPKELPRKSMFAEVRCHDLSQGGISFFMPRPPKFQLAVFGLGKRPNLTYLLAQVVYCKEHVTAKREYLVGCSFIRRVTIRE